ncbi:MAG: transporter substrate-binding domain-containing protein [Desulfarculaceae bacterium]|nr:transporter substrate-binding domain-containing protein [Desulfarculaceae bacterium]MCF8074078.1 transporter substrate-binding domain-containing protein [Desulfarculaceae bacterium]MCF8102084.1 transporter substrate-binding domain-containing protein [Desulfarculaceae bacterium]
MLKRLCALAALAAALLLAAAPALAGPVLDRVLKEKTLVVGIATGMPPLSAKTAKGEFIGLDVDLVKDLAASLGVKIRFEPMAFDKLIPAAAAGEVDVAVGGITITPQRNARVFFAGPYFVSGQTLLATREVGAGINGLADVNRPGFSVAVAKDTTSEGAARSVMPKAKFVLTENNDAALKLVLSGKVKAMVADYPYCAVAVFRNPEAKLGTLQKPFTFEPLGLALPPGDPLWDNLVTNFLFNMEGGGKMSYLKNRWFQNPSWMRLLPK